MELIQKKPFPCMCGSIQHFWTVRFDYLLFWFNLESQFDSGLWIKFLCWFFTEQLFHFIFSSYILKVAHSPNFYGLGNIPNFNLTVPYNTPFVFAEMCLKSPQRCTLGYIILLLTELCSAGWRLLLGKLWIIIYYNDPVPFSMPKWELEFKYSTSNPVS